MTLHLAEISRTVTPGAHAVVLLDQAGWHLSDKLDILANITLMPLPPKSPELNPSRTSGSSSATASSAPTTTSSSTAASPGTSSSTSPGPSCQSACAIGPIGSNQWDLVIRADTSRLTEESAAAAAGGHY
jgi:hypothetical protein